LKNGLGYICFHSDSKKLLSREMLFFHNVLGALVWDGGAEWACGCVFVFAEWAGVAVAGEFF
jgi:hypothetical protein